MAKSKSKKKGLSDAKLSKASSTKPPNPFMLRVNKQKFNVIGRTSKFERGMPGVARSKAIKRRKETLLQEFKLKDKSNKFFDRRIGENNKAMTAEDKIMARFTAEQMKAQKKKTMFNLAEDEETLTHQGRSISEVERFDDPRDLDDEDCDETVGRLDGEFVEAAHFGGGVLSKVSVGRESVIAELIAESKKRRAERQQTKEKTLELTERLDAEWRDLLPVMQSGPVLTEPEARSSGRPNLDSYDTALKMLSFEARGKPSDKLKSEEEMAAEEAKKLEQLEQDRLRRMKGETTEVKVSKIQHRSADDLDDGFTLADEQDFSLKYDDKGNAILPKSREDNSDGEVEESTIKSKETWFGDEENIETDEENSENESESDEDSFSDLQIASADENNESGESCEENKPVDFVKIEKNEDDHDSGNDSDEDEIVSRNKASESQKSHFDCYKKSKKSEESKKSETIPDTAYSDAGSPKVSKTVQEEIKTPKELLKETDNKSCESDNKMTLSLKVTEQEECGSSEIPKSGSKETDLEESATSKNINKKAISENSNSSQKLKSNLKETGDEIACKMIVIEKSSQEIKKSKVSFNAEVEKVTYGENALSIGKQSTEEIREMLQKRKDIMEKARKELPFTFPAPENYKELESMLEGKSADQVAVVVERIIRCHHPSLKQENKEKMADLFAYLMQHLNDMNPKECWKRLECLTPLLYDLAHFNPSAAANCLVEVLKEKQADHTNKRHKYPSTDTVIFLKLIPTLFSASDKRHPVATPAVIFILQLLQSCKVTTRRSVVAGLFLVSILYEYVYQSKRFCPQALNFLLGVISLAAPPVVLNTSVVPPFNPTHRFLYLRNNCSINGDLKLTANDICSHGKVDDPFRVRSLYMALSLLDLFANLYKNHTAIYLAFERIIPCLENINIERYPGDIGKLVDSLKSILENMSSAVLEPVAREQKKPKALRLYEPCIKPVYDTKKAKRGNNEKAEREKLLHKYKREMKGALREIRRDTSFLSSVQFKQQAASDAERKRKVDEIVRWGAEQQNEANRAKKKIKSKF